MKSVKKILVLQTAFIGDVVLTTPLIRETKRAFPQARLDVLVIPQTRSVLENNPHIHSLITFDKRDDKHKAFRDTVKTLRANSYDLCLIPHRSFTSARLALSAKIPVRIGFRGRLPSLFYTRRIFFDRGKIQIQRYLDMLRAIDDREYDIQTKIYSTPQTDEKIKHLLTPLVNSDARIIALAPGSVWPTKRWPEEYFTELVKKLAEHNFGLVLIGSQDEQALCERIIENAGAKNIINLAGKTSLLQAAAVIKTCDLLVCNDSGTMHIANAVQTDVATFFGPTVQRFGFAPFRSTDKIFEIDIECRPCSAHGGETCPQGHFKCMLDIKADSVYDFIVEKFVIIEKQNSISDNSKKV